ncbi:hypothetical protein PROFUN_14567 [Planoprotostelium fungivorum]|uniref:Uncharacterized protein n=1 Tax=Planoprotostelium fungivorum TaxID=1890364 RepID=A0A2P6MZB4_9EUKA|nr:hypothetical protein PROFUN_14567 [Planoprotostelium fungivorum]
MLLVIFNQQAGRWNAVRFVSNQRVRPPSINSNLNRQLADSRPRGNRAETFESIPDGSLASVVFVASREYNTIFSCDQPPRRKPLRHTRYALRAVRAAMFQTVKCTSEITSAGGVPPHSSDIARSEFVCFEEEPLELSESLPQSPHRWNLQMSVKQIISDVGLVDRDDAQLKKIVGTKDGRIFMEGLDGHFEILYGVKEHSFQKKCHTSSGILSIFK